MPPSAAIGADEWNHDDLFFALLLSTFAGILVLLKTAEEISHRVITNSGIRAANDKDHQKMVYRRKQMRRTEFVRRS